MSEPFAPPTPVRFDGYPYLVTRVAPAFYHIIVLPAGFRRSQYLRVATRQFEANDLPTCVAFSATDAQHVGPLGVSLRTTEAPAGGFVVMDRLGPPEPIAFTPDILARRARLKRFIEAQHVGGYLFGDLSKGGHRADADELRALAGVQENGVPVGLERCSLCGDWRGTCLDPSPEFKGMVMEVACRCQNQNRCAWCGHLLAERKLNANQYSEVDGMIWHLPGFAALEHRCLEPILREASANYAEREE